MAIVHVRIVSVAKEDVGFGTILVRGEKILEVGKDVKVPDGTRIIEGRGLVAFPGMVNAASRIGASDTLGTGGGAATPLYAAVDDINPASEIWTTALRTGITTYGVHPAGGTIGGQGALLKPVGLQKETMVIDKSAFLRITLQANSASKEALRQALDSARRELEAEKKNPKHSPTSPAPSTKGMEEKPSILPSASAPAAASEAKPSPVARFLKGEIPAFAFVNGPAEALHFWQVMDAFSEFKTRIILVTGLESYKVAGELGKRKAHVILRPDLTFAPFTRDRVNPAAELLRAGAQIAFAPGADSGEPVESYLFRVGEMVKYGVAREAALRAITLAPAEMLGIEKRVGSIEAGKDADLLLFDGDPLSVGARLRRVFINGKEVYSGE